MKDLDNHRKECKKVGDELASLKEEVDNMRRKYDLNIDYVEANTDINNHLVLNTVISDIKLVKDSCEKE